MPIRAARWIAGGTVVAGSFAAAGGSALGLSVSAGSLPSVPQLQPPSQLASTPHVSVPAVPSAGHVAAPQVSVPAVSVPQTPSVPQVHVPPAPSTPSLPSAGNVAPALGGGSTGN